jgi:hypothetical protein
MNRKQKLIYPEIIINDTKCIHKHHASYQYAEYFGVIHGATVICVIILGNHPSQHMRNIRI